MVCTEGKNHLDQASANIYNWYSQQYLKTEMIDI